MKGELIAFDIGDRHIGVAVSDPQTNLVFTRPTIDIDHPQHAVHAIQRYVSEMKPEAVIVGHPLSLRGDVGPQAAAVEQIVEQLRPRLACEIHLVDERMTTAMAKRHAPRTDDHAEAARLILETFLSQRTHL